MRGQAEKKILDIERKIDSLQSSLGLGFLNYTPYLLPLTVLFWLSASPCWLIEPAVAWGYGPFFLGLLAATAVIVGKFFPADTEAASSAGVDHV